MGALLTNDTLPDTLPTTAGANATLKFVLCPGVSVKGDKPPDREPLPVTEPEKESSGRARVCQFDGLRVGVPTTTFDS